MINPSNLLKRPLPALRGNSRSQVDYSSKVNHCSSTEIIFRNHKDRLIEFFSRYPVFLGAVAWFTDEDLVIALSGKKVAVLVQKEDFLRPDEKGTRDSLRSAYSLLTPSLSSKELPGIVPTIRALGPFEIEPFRCVGNHNSEKSPAFPRMHNKFLIGCDYDDRIAIDEFSESNLVLPRAVWTGSFNFSLSASRSFENSVIITDDRVATSFANEWAQIFAFSEPLDWTSKWVSPEYYIGT